MPKAIPIPDENRTPPLRIGYIPPSLLTAENADRPAPNSLSFSPEVLPPVRDAALTHQTDAETRGRVFRGAPNQACSQPLSPAWKRRSPSILLCAPSWGASARVWPWREGHPATVLATAVKTTDNPLFTTPDPILPDAPGVKRNVRQTSSLGQIFNPRMTRALRGLCVLQRTMRPTATQRATVTQQWARSITSAATDPSTNRFTPRLSPVPMTMSE